MLIYWAKRKCHKGNTEAPLNAAKESGLEVKADRIK
jgi:hypothetical protein